MMTLMIMHGFIPGIIAIRVGNESEAGVRGYRGAETRLEF
jgi:hypothetical protein